MFWRQIKQEMSDARNADLIVAVVARARFKPNLQLGRFNANSTRTSSQVGGDFLGWHFPIL
jgi:hypothetical protein